MNGNEAKRVLILLQLRGGVVLAVKFPDYILTFISCLFTTQPLTLFNSECCPNFDGETYAVSMELGCMCLR